MHLSCMFKWNWTSSPKFTSTECYPASVTWTSLTTEKKLESVAKSQVWWILSRVGRIRSWIPHTFTSTLNMFTHMFGYCLCTHLILCLVISVHSEHRTMKCTIIKRWDLCSTSSFIRNEWVRSHWVSFLSLRNNKFNPNAQKHVLNPKQIKSSGLIKTTILSTQLMHNWLHDTHTFWFMLFY